MAYIVEYRGRVIINKRGQKDYKRKRKENLPSPHPLLQGRDGRVPNVSKQKYDE